MQLFLDTASLDAIRRWQPFGVVEGATTNPALLAKEGGDPLEQLVNVAELVAGPVSAQVTASEAEGMVAQGRSLAALAANIVVKVPATLAGCAAARRLTESGVRCNVTLTFHPAQAIAFARIPVAYVSLIVGRTEDFGLETRAEIARTRELLAALGTETKLLVASLRNPAQLAAAVLGGADVVTVPPATWDLVYQNPLSLQGLADFHSAWTTLPAERRARYERLGER
ncbi:MAG: transaldolase family protein [Planctomycetota bacterium]